VKNVILVGIPYAGKSTLGKSVAELLELDFFDTDQMIYEKIDYSLEKRGFWSNLMCFASAQEPILDDLRNIPKPSIIGTGAELPLENGRDDVLKELGNVIHIKRDPSVIIECIRKRFKDLVNDPDVNVSDSTLYDMRDASELRVTSYQEFEDFYGKMSNATLINNGDKDTGLRKLIKIILNLPEN
jgi:shikimate kinase